MLADLSRYTLQYLTKPYKTLQNPIPLCKNISVQMAGYKWKNEVGKLREFGLNVI
jgi:hypothetical protein